MDDLDWHLTGWISALVLVVGIVIWASVIDAKREARLMKQCMEDGRKEYECESLLSKPKASVVAVPVVIGR